MSRPYTLLRRGEDHTDPLTEAESDATYEPTGAVAAHESAGDPHPQYTTAAELNAAVSAAVAALVDSSPGTLDTLNELAAALGDDPNFAATMAAALAAIPTLAHGTYTPTLVNVANVASSTAFVCQYMRVGDVVTVSGAVTIDPTLATTSTTIRMSLPIASAIGNAQEIAGTGCSITGTTATPVMIFGSAPNDDAAFNCVAPSTAAFTLYFTFTYRVL